MSSSIPFTILQKLFSTKKTFKLIDKQWRNLFSAHAQHFLVEKIHSNRFILFFSHRIRNKIEISLLSRSSLDFNAGKFVTKNSISSNAAKGNFLMDKQGAQAMDSEDSKSVLFIYIIYEYFPVWSSYLKLLFWSFGKKKTFGQKNLLAKNVSDKWG